MLLSTGKSPQDKKHKNTHTHMISFNFKNNSHFRSHRADSFHAQGLYFERYVVTDPCYIRALLPPGYTPKNSDLAKQLEDLTGRPAIVANNGGDGCRGIDGVFVVHDDFYGTRFTVDSGRFAFFRATPEVYAELVGHLGSFFDGCCAFVYCPWRKLGLRTYNCLDGVQDLIVMHRYDFDDDDEFSGIYVRYNNKLCLSGDNTLCDTCTRHAEEERRKKRERERAEWLARHELRERSYWTRSAVIAELRRRGDNKIAKALNNKFFVDDDLCHVVSTDCKSWLHYVSSSGANSLVSKINERRLSLGALWGKKRRVYGKLRWQESVKSGRRFRYVDYAKEGYAAIDGDWVKLFDGAGKSAKLLTKRKLYSTSSPSFEAIKK